MKGTRCAMIDWEKAGMTRVPLSRSKSLSVEFLDFVKLSGRRKGHRANAVA